MNLDQFTKDIFKVIILGMPGVGKSSLIDRLCNDSFSEERKATIGVEHSGLVIEENGRNVKLQFWDYSGQPHFRTISALFDGMGAHAGLLVIDVSRSPNENHLEWFKIMKKMLRDPEKSPVLLIGNKTDKRDGYEGVSEETGQNFAQKIGATYIEISAKTKEGIEELQSILRKKLVGITNE